MGFFESIFTPPGTNARRDQEKRQTSVAGVGTDLVSIIAPGVKKQAEYANTLQPALEANVNDAILSLQPGNLAADAERKAGAIGGATEDAIRDVGLGLRSQGLSEGAIAGTAADISNQGTEQQNQVRAEQWDPQRLNAIRGQIIQMITGMQTLPSMQALSGASSMVYGQPAVHVGQGVGDIVGNVLGQWAGGGFKTPGSGSNQP